MIFRRLLQSYGVSILLRQQRNVSILNSLKHSPVLISSNNDVYTNLALEHWLYSNLEFNSNAQDERAFDHPIVLIWTDEPCVVMGRHQNPWIEATMGFLDKAGIKLARRHSGGGCVYHDLNNVNISIIGSRKLFENRHSNLKFLAGVLDEKYGIKCEPTKRHDLVHCETGLKMSGSAAKLGKDNCYHHFTLLVDTDKEVMQTAIRQSQQDYIYTNSSLSKRSSVINLKELKSELNVDQVISDLAIAYGELYKNPRAKEPSRKSGKTNINQAAFLTLDKIRTELEDWQWIYGRTPKFKLQRQLNLLDNNVRKEVQITVHIDHGLFKKIEVEGGLSTDLAYKFSFLIGQKFDYKDSVVSIVKKLQVDDADPSTLLGCEQIFATFLLQMIHEANF